MGTRAEAGSSSAGPCPPGAYSPPHPPRSGFTHTTQAHPTPLHDVNVHKHSSLMQATSSHCFVTVDLDLNHGYVRFFRNGHIIGAAFYGLAGPISPMLAFAQAPNLHCQVRAHSWDRLLLPGAQSRFGARACVCEALDA
eukprot:scaffold40694_cov21-Tisochrysis_lutea.AAC.4